MPILETGVRAVTGRMPKVISPKAHAIIDYALAGAFIFAGIKALRGRSHKAAISAFIAAGSEIATAMLTDYPGGVARVIDYPTHLKIDAGFSGLVGSMPNLMDFSEDWAAWFFRSQAIALAAVVGLSEPRPYSRRLRTAA